MDAISERYGLYTVNFGHAGDGNLHVSLAERSGPVSEADAERAGAEILAATVELGGRIAGEHGIGILKNEHLSLNLNSPTIELMKRIKNVLDPLSILNPGKIFPTS
jgi:glycolate oxidase